MSRRLPGLDAVRGLAMLAMTATHAQRILVPENRPALGRFLMDWEPVIPTLFTLLLGASLALSLGKTRDQVRWIQTQRRRAFGLWMLSAGLFLLHFGPQWPALLTSTGILQCLGISILAVTLFPTARLALGAGILLFLAWLGLEGQGGHIDGLNQGSFPVFPYVPFALLAFGTVRTFADRSVRSWLLASAGVVATLWLWFGLGWGHLGESGSGVVLNRQILYFTRAHQNEGFSLTYDLLQGVVALPRELVFWHTRPSLALFLLLSCGSVAFLLSRLVDFLPRLFAGLSLAGRHSLGYYVLHFVGLGAWSMLPSALRGDWTWLHGTLATFALGIGISWFFEHFRRKTTA